MWIEIERFGPIKKFTYDMDKDLIITYGNNNIGKSYAMQIVYLLLKAFLGQSGESMRLMEYMKGIYAWNNERMSEEKLENLVGDFWGSEETTKDITDVIIQEVYSRLGSVLLLEFLNSCRNTFGNFDKTLEKQPIIRVKQDKFEFEMNLKAKEIQGTIDLKPVELKKVEEGLQKAEAIENQKYLEIFVTEETKYAVEMIREQIRCNLKACTEAIDELFEDVYFLPASRSGIYSGMSSFGPIVAELSKNRYHFKKKIELPGISEPISDYFIALSNVKSTVNKRMSEYYTKIEDDILKGKVTFDEMKNALMYTPENMDVPFGMTEVSSMVSEISPIVVFLKYILFAQFKNEKRKKSILFIEEPEAHLHPQNQIALIEIFAKMIDADVKLIMSSHSNYIFNKLNNLVLGKELDYERYQPIILMDSDGGSESKILPIDELGADDENFIDVSEKLYFERGEIIQQLNGEE